MSTPITACLVSRAIHDEVVYRELLERWRNAKKCGAVSVWPCEHKPPCPMPTDEQLTSLEKRLEIDLLISKPANAEARS